MMTNRSAFVVRSIRILIGYNARKSKSAEDLTGTILSVQESRQENLKISKTSILSVNFANEAQLMRTKAVRKNPTKK